MELKLNISTETTNFLRQFAATQYEGAENNKGTYKPVHLVQTERRDIVRDGGNSNIDSETKAYSLTQYPSVVVFSPKDLIEEACLHHIIDNSAKDKDPDDFSDIDEYFDACGLDTYEYEEVSVHTHYETKALFFTLIEARKYIKYQAHNLTNPRTYTVSGGYSNHGDYEPFWDFLMAAGNAIIENDMYKMSFNIGQDNCSGVECASKEEFLNYMSEAINQAARNGHTEFNVEIYNEGGE